MNIEAPDRKHPRLKGYDYSQSGAYFITFCTKDRREILGSVVGRDALGAPSAELSEYGNAVRAEIEKTPMYYDGVIIDKYIVMPNHVHMIIMVDSVDGAPRASRPTGALIPRIIAAIKKKTNKAAGFMVWQRSYHDHVIRSDADYLRIWQYIDENPAKWDEDEYNRGL